ncbi:MAG: beta-ketoacyl-ACP reductase [Melioribacteraceae bacterium]|nr:MAG: beta-ketoacyl-ACP reductase [Melioribacteraceae bacterium]
MKKLENKVAIITGGSRGIGEATVEKFVEDGAKVAIWDVDVEAGTALETKLKEQGADARFYKVNVADDNDVQTAVDKVVEDFGTIDILVNNAGITRDSTLKKMTQEQWDQVISVNLKGVFNCTQKVSLVMLEKKYGRIVNTSSVVGLYGNFGQTNYVATKAGVIGMTKVWAKELGRKGITVNAVAPGFIATEMVKAMPENVIKMMEDKTPVGRLGEPKDIANAYAFLASDEASFINGATLSVDGGIVI